MMLSYGLILLVCLISGWLFSLLCIGRGMVLILGSVVSLMFIFYELWAGERLVLEKAVPR